MDESQPIHLPRPHTMSKTKFFCIGTEGATTDGRTIERAHLQQMADSYNPQTYNARINPEHYKGLLPDGPFKRYGDVVALKTEERNGKLALLAQLDPTPDLVALSKARQKIHMSMEIDPDFADTGRAYLVGVAITDDPASLGTDMLQFCASASTNPLASRKLNERNLFTAAQEACIEFEDAADAETQELREARGLLAGLKKLFTAPAAEQVQQQPAAPAAAPAAPQAQDAGVLQQLSQSMQQLADLQVKTTERLDAMARQLQEQDTRYQQLSQQPDESHQRPPATGGSGYRQEF